MHRDASIAAITGEKPQSIAAGASYSSFRRHHRSTRQRVKWEHSSQWKYKILRKPGPLDDAEKVIMRKHCEIGYNTLSRVPFLLEAADIVLAHHEFFDGTGYPRGLRGEQIPLGSRIISIANALDAMLSDCPYRNAYSMSHAREEIRRCAGTQFDPKNRGGISLHSRKPLYRSA